MEPIKCDLPSDFDLVYEYLPFTECNNYKVISGYGKFVKSHKREPTTSIGKYADRIIQKKLSNFPKTFRKRLEVGASILLGDEDFMKELRNAFLKGDLIDLRWVMSGPSNQSLNEKTWCNNLGRNYINFGLITVSSSDVTDWLSIEKEKGITIKRLHYVRNLTRLVIEEIGLVEFGRLFPEYILDVLSCVQITDAVSGFMKDSYG